MQHNITWLAYRELARDTDNIPIEMRPAEQTKQEWCYAQR